MFNGFLTTSCDRVKLLNSPVASTWLYDAIRHILPSGYSAKSVSSTVLKSVCYIHLFADNTAGFVVNTCG